MSKIGNHRVEVQESEDYTALIERLRHGTSFDDAQDVMQKAARQALKDTAP
jgi:hypothetical protein